MIRVSIVLIVKDEPTIHQTLNKLFDQITTRDTEVIVVDASEGRLSEISRQYSQVIWIDFRSRNLRKKITIAEQRNVGVHASKGEIIVFCDAGSSPYPGWLDAITAPLLAGDHVLVGGPVRAINPSSLDTWTNLQQDGDEIQYPTTANLALTRSSFDLVTGFNEDLEYGSDADLVWRLNIQGIKQICISNAVMGLDGGTKKRELRRAWQYGKALADLLTLHPKKRLPKSKSNPEIWIYPVLTAIAFLSLPLFGFSTYLAFTFLTANLLLTIRNLKTKHALQVLARHYVYGWGFCYQLIRKKLPKFKLPKVLIYPSDDIRYLKELYKSFKLLEEKSISIAPFPKLTFSNTCNIFILPFISPILRFRGARIVHIHWIYRFRLIWPKGRISRTLIEYWFKFWIQSLKWSDLKIIWTAHNILPHEPIFLDDFKIRKYLCRNSESVIALSESAKEEVAIKFATNQILVIPEGPLVHPTTYNITKFREMLGVPANNLLAVSLGNLARYKGVADLLMAACSVNKKVSIRVAGWCDSKDEAELRDLCQVARAHDIDIQITFGKLTSNEYGAYLQAADFYVAPFRVITNSGSLNAALTAGLPIVIPNLPSLDWVPKQAAILYQHKPDSIIELATVINSLSNISKEKIDSMRSAAHSFTEELSWLEISKEHYYLYQNMITNSGRYST
jgi:glycosyltransferase involved in cell wall biosynthesis